MRRGDETRMRVLKKKQVFAYLPNRRAEYLYLPKGVLQRNAKQEIFHRVVCDDPGQLRTDHDLWTFD